MNHLDKVLPEDITMYYNVIDQAINESTRQFEYKGILFTKLTVRFYTQIPSESSYYMCDLKKSKTQTYQNKLSKDIQDEYSVIKFIDKMIKAKVTSIQNNYDNIRDTKQSNLLETIRNWAKDEE